jgi:hypothetical protein
MVNIWRRSPSSRLSSGDLVRKSRTSAVPSITTLFFEIGVYSLSMSEGAVVSDIYPARRAYPTDRGETAATDDAYSAAVYKRAAIAEVADIIDVFSGASLLVTLMQERAAIMALQGGTVASVAALSESAVTGDGYSNSISQPAAIDESAAAADGYDGLYFLATLMEEIAVSGSSFDAIYFLRVQVQEIAIITERIRRSITTQASISESAQTYAAFSNRLKAVAALAETMGISEVFNARSILRALQWEVAAVDALYAPVLKAVAAVLELALIEGGPFGGKITALSVLEAVETSDDYLAMVNKIVALIESAAASDYSVADMDSSGESAAVDDDYGVNIKYAVAVHESAAISDAPAVGAMSWAVAVAEAVAAVDGYYIKTAAVGFAGGALRVMPNIPAQGNDVRIRVGGITIGLPVQDVSDDRAGAIRVNMGGVIKSIRQSPV